MASRRGCAFAEASNAIFRSGCSARAHRRQAARAVECAPRGERASGTASRSASTREIWGKRITESELLAHGGQVRSACCRHLEHSVGGSAKSAVAQHDRRRNERQQRVAPSATSEILGAAQADFKRSSNGMMELLLEPLIKSWLTGSWYFASGAGRLARSAVVAAQRCSCSPALRRPSRAGSPMRGVVPQRARLVGVRHGRGARPREPDGRPGDHFEGAPVRP